MAQFSRGYQMSFGKNRVQYTDFLWTFYRFKNFDTYYYLGGQELAQYTGRVAENEITEIEQLFDYKINGRFQFIIYNKLTDFEQSNIGLGTDELNTNTGGLTKIAGNKVLVYFDGDYRHFKEQLRAGISQVLINQLLYGGSIKERVQSAAMINFPDWYIKGLVTYVAKGWPLDNDNQLRQLINEKGAKNFNALCELNSQLAGQSLWNFVVTRYGPSTISNLIYMSRVNKNIEGGFVYVIGSSLKELNKNWMDYYTQVYQNDDSLFTSISQKPAITFKKKSQNITQVKLSPDGKSVAYIENNSGKYKLFIYDLNKNKKHKIFKGGFKHENKSIDETNPVIAWHPSGKYLTSIFEKKGKYRMDYFELGKRIKHTSNKFYYFDKVLDFSYSSSGNDIVLTGVQKGQSDIFIFNPRTKFTRQITNDRWDDKNAKFVMNDQYLVFQSTRFTDSLKSTSLKQREEIYTSKTSDLFLYDCLNFSPKLIQLTNTPLVNETDPLMIDNVHFMFLSDVSGVRNRQLATLDSTIAFIDTSIHYKYIFSVENITNYKNDILLQDVNSSKTQSTFLNYSGSRYKLYTNENNALTNQPIIPIKKTIQRKSLDGEGIPKERQKEVATIIDVTTLNKSTSQNNDTTISHTGNSFITDFPKVKKTATINVITNSSSTSPDTIKSNTADSVFYQMPKQRNYEIAFAPTYVLTQLDNSLINETYQTFTGGAVFFDPGLNGLFKVGLNDLMDDYRLVGGVKLSGNLNSNEYYLSFENLKHQIDQQWSFYRQSREEIYAYDYLKINTHNLRYSARYPFNDLTSLRWSTSIRNDRIVNLSTDIANLLAPTYHENWVSSRLEFVHDNTVSTGLNLFNGIRYKLFAEYFDQLDRGKSDLTVLGMDFRFYKKIHRQIIWANRLAASTSFGNDKLIYYLGSTDNCFTPVNNFNENIQIDYSKNYAFQTVASNLRGFTQNIRNGNSFALINSEIRIPIFQYLIHKPIRTDFFRNFQVVGFGDFGTAWTGTSPYSKNNSLFKADYPGNPISITVTKDIEPFVGGYGFGLRSRVLGYFVRADWAWGMDDGVKQPRIFYFSLGLDF
ncbi:MAG: hypothetical protein ACKOX3_11540 [Bacteroidota bacterium]